MAYYINNHSDFKNLKIDISFLILVHISLVLDMFYDGQKNPLRFDVHLQPQVRCTFNFQWFPWDEQICLINLMITNMDQMEPQETSDAIFTKQLDLEEYSIANLTLFHNNETKSKTIRIHLKRYSMQYVYDSYFPTALLLLLGYGTFFLPMAPLSDRGTMSLTTLLVLVALYTDSLHALPDVNYNTYLDNWYIFSMAYLSLIVASHIMARGSRFLSYCKVIFGAGFLIFVIVYNSING